MPTAVYLFRVEEYTPNVSREHQEQVALFQWAERLSTMHPQLNNLFAIPNGGKRHVVTAVKLKRDGVKAGVPDIFLACPTNDFHGLFIEMKAGKNKTQESQKDWLSRLNRSGYFTVVAYSWTDAAKVIIYYLNFPKSLLANL